MRRENNFDLLRLVFALTVVLVHCHDLSLEPSLAWITRIFDSRIAVEGFFVMSGFLIVGSFDRSRSVLSYFEKRTRRIMPAYYATLLFGLGIGSLFSILPLTVFWTSHITWQFIFATVSFATFLHPSLPGLFNGNPTGSTVNGALWTIKLEVLFYLIVPFLVALCRRFGSFLTLFSIFLLSLLYRFLCQALHYDRLTKQLPGQLCFFAAGCLAYFYFEELYTYKRWLWAAGISAFLVYLVFQSFVIEVLAVSLLVLCFSLLFPTVEGPTRFGDFSYGIYVFHYPIVQLLIALGLFRTSPLLGTATVFVLVTILAIFSWKFIEHPALRKSAHATTKLL